MKTRFRVTVSLAPPASDASATAEPTAPAGPQAVSGTLAGLVVLPDQKLEVTAQGPRVVAAPERPPAGATRTFFAYADCPEDAERRVREQTGLAGAYAVEAAGHAEGGRIAMPADEQAAIAASLQEGSGGGAKRKRPSQPPARPDAEARPSGRVPKRAKAAVTAKEGSLGRPRPSSARPPKE